MNEHQEQPLQRHEPSTLPTGQSEATAPPVDEAPSVLPAGQDRTTGQSEATAPPVDEAPSVLPAGQDQATGPSEGTALPAEEAPRENVSPVRALFVRVRDTCKNSMQRAIQVRDTTTVIRLSDEACGKVDTLIAAGVFESRGETTAFLIDEGIHAQEPLFRDIEQKMGKIESLKSELRSAHQGHG